MAKIQCIVMYKVNGTICWSSMYCAVNQGSDKALSSTELFDRTAKRL
jgi:hypothetical protein